MSHYYDVLKAICDEQEVVITRFETINKDLIEAEVEYANYNPMDLNAIENIARIFAEQIDYEIALDLSSAGAQRLVDPQDYGIIKDKYVRVIFNEPMLDADYVEGIVKEVSEESIEIAYRVVHATKEISIPISNIKELSLTVNI